MRDVANSSSLVRRFKPTRHRPFARTVGSEFVLHARAITYNEGSPPAHAQKSKVQIWDKPSRSLSRRSCARGHGRLERRPTRRRRRLLRARRGVDVAKDSMSLPPDTKRVTKRWHVVPTDDETPARAKAAAELEARLRKEVADFDSWAWCRPRRPRSRSRRRRGHAHVDCPWRHGATPRLTGGPRRRDAGDFACRRRRRRRHRPRRRRHGRRRRRTLGRGQPAATLLVVGRRYAADGAVLRRFLTARDGDAPAGAAHRSLCDFEMYLAA